jgi:hypothetical protein
MSNNTNNVYVCARLYTHQELENSLTRTSTPQFCEQILMH